MVTIYKNYTTNELYLDKPCYIEGVGFIYPLKAKEFIGFVDKYWKYIGYSEKVMDSFNLGLTGNYISKLISLNMIMYLGESQNKNDNILDKDGGFIVINKIINEINSLLSLATHKKIFLNNTNDDFCFCDKDKTVIINATTYDIVRKVILQQNVLSEVKYYEDAEYGKIMREARERMNKSNGIYPIEFIEMISQVKIYNKLTIDEVLNENVFQIYCDYAALTNLEDYRTTMNFKLVDYDNKLKTKPILSPFIDNLYKETDDSELIKQVDLDGNNF